MEQKMLEKNEVRKTAEDAARATGQSGVELTNEALEKVTGGIRLITTPDDTSGDKN